MNNLGLIGKTLKHSFSKNYFTNKFQQENISDWRYDLYEIESVEQMLNLFKNNPGLIGLNVTIPYKQEVIELLDDISEEARRVGAVNTIKKEGNKLVGYNSDVYGFERSLFNLLEDKKVDSAWILGTGGAAKAVHYVLEKNQIHSQFVSRTKKNDIWDYQHTFQRHINIPPLIINTTPLGMYPQVDNAPELPYHKMTKAHFLFDLVYNPIETKFLKLGKAQGAKVQNGLEMLHLQADKSWEIWNA